MQNFEFLWLNNIVQGKIWCTIDMLALIFYLFLEALIVLQISKLVKLYK